MVAAALVTVGVGAAPAQAGDHDPAFVVRKWTIVPPQKDTCFYGGGFNPGPDAYYDDTLAPTCGAYYYQVFVNPSGEYYQYMYNEITGRHYTYLGLVDPGPPTNIPQDKVKQPDPPVPYGATVSKPEEFSGAIVGTWRIRPVNLGTWYVRNTMTVAAGGYGVLRAKDADACNWQIGSPVYRDLKGHGPTYTGQRYLGPCVDPAAAWVPVTITVSADGTTLTESVSGFPTLLTWVRDPKTYDCGAGTFTAQDLIAWARSMQMPDAELVAWLDKPCGSATLVATVDGHQVTPDPGKDGGKDGKCEIARDRVNGYIKLNGRSIEVGHADMVTSYCHNGKVVYNAGTDEAPHHATFQNPSATNNFFLSCSYTGSLDNDFAYGWTDDTKRGFYTTGTIGFTCTGPALALAITAGPAQAGVTFNKNGNAYLTATQTVWQDGRTEFRMGGRP